MSNTEITTAAATVKTTKAATVRGRGRPIMADNVRVHTAVRNAIGKMEGEFTKKDLRKKVVGANIKSFQSAVNCAINSGALKVVGYQKSGGRGRPSAILARA